MLLKQPIQMIYISLQMLIVVQTHRFFINVGLQEIIWIG